MIQSELTRMFTGKPGRAAKSARIPGNPDDHRFQEDRSRMYPVVLSWTSWRPWRLGGSICLVLFVCFVGQSWISIAAILSGGNDIAIPKVEFVDLAAEAGLNFRHLTGNDRSREYILESTGSGVALIDYDNDGFLDIFFVNGTTLEGSPKGQEPTNRLFRNNRDKTFKDVTEQANLVQIGRASCRERV